MSVSLSPRSIAKQEAIDTLDAELSKRINALRQQCAFLTKSLRTRCEIRLSRYNEATRKTKLSVLIDRHESSKIVRTQQQQRQRTANATSVSRFGGNKENIPTSPVKSISTTGLKRRAIASPAKPSPTKVVKRGNLGTTTTASEAKKTTTVKRQKRGQ